MYVRTCQECGHQQPAKPPHLYRGESWRDTKCQKCQSPGLDYGSDGWIMCLETNGKTLFVHPSRFLPEDAA